VTALWSLQGESRSDYSLSGLRILQLEEHLIGGHALHLVLSVEIARVAADLIDRVRIPVVPADRTLIESASKAYIVALVRHVQ